MKRFLMLLGLAITMLTGMEVQAADTKDADAIMKQCIEVTNAKKVIRLDEYVAVGDVREKILTAIVDNNTQITYLDMLDMQIYVDDKNQLTYMYDSTEKKWYVASTNDSEDTDEITLETDTPDMATNYTYKETILYQNVRCDVIEATLLDTSISNHIVYYVNESTYELLYSSQMSDELGVEIIIEYSYPESVTLPQSVVQRAVMFPGSSVTVKGIEYTAPIKGTKRTVEVTNGKKASGKVSIPDKITFADKEYKVIGIAYKAFAKNNKIKKVTLGKNIKTIGKQAFYKCKKLNQVTIRSTCIKKIGSKAFYGNAKKLKVQTPKSKRVKYRKMIEKSKTSSKLKM